MNSLTVFVLFSLLCVGNIAAFIGLGQSNTYRKQDAGGNYAFGYDINDGKGSTNFRNENGDGFGNKVGSYGLQDADGRVRTVQYVADAGGFRATIKTNEPGTKSGHTAAATYNGGGPAVHAAGPGLAKPGFFGLY